MKKYQRLLSAVVLILFSVTLTLLSGHPFETGLFFAGACLLQSQAGGLETAGLLPKLVSFLTLWILGGISYPVVCPRWLLYPLLFLANATIYLFAPATSQEEPEKSGSFLEWEQESIPWRTAEQWQELRRQKKNRAVFITLLLSVFTIARYGKPVSSLLLVMLLVEMVSILGVIWRALQEQSNHSS